ncbi:MAG: hypothetical protein H6684_02570 [Deltaproteobacteria bacterium]|nr:hypothetical protein [Deltaproteobacteria bacterium]MCB9487598.1 hypothetical protein [Deltaproteobacteria bacterium]
MTTTTSTTTTTFGPTTALVCGLPDPAGLGGGNMTGGGAIVNQVEVYVFDDDTCQPLAGASVITSGGTQTTGADGLAIVSTDGPTSITAGADGYIAWTYNSVDASVQYMRLITAPVEEAPAEIVDRTGGRFLSGGSALNLKQPGLLQLTLGKPIFLGVALPGFGRAQFFQTKMDEMFSTTTFDFLIDAIGDEPTPLPANIYMPEMDYGLNIGDLSFNVYGKNETFTVPIDDEDAANPIEGVTMSLGKLLSILGPALGDEPDIPAIVASVFDNLKIDYAGAKTDWNGIGAPDIDVLAVNDGNSAISLTNTIDGVDYLGVSVAEVPNRAFYPIGIDFAPSSSTPSKSLSLPYENMGSLSDYMVMVMATESLQNGGESLAFSIAARFADTTSQLAGGYTVDTTTMLSQFDPLSTGYDDLACEVYWAEDGSGSADADVYVVLLDPVDGPAVYAVVDPSQDSVAFPCNELGIIPSLDDVAIVIGADLPTGVSVDEFNPFNLLGYNNANVNIWTNLNVDTLFGGILEEPGMLLMIDSLMEYAE